jgi:histidinol-phosphate aminotransferase
MRVGLAFAHEALIHELLKVKDSYNVSRLAQAAGCAALADDDYFVSTRDAVLAAREKLSGGLAGQGFTVLPSDANFIFVVPPAGISARALYERLLARGFLVRHLAGAAVSDGLRISVGTAADMDALAAAVGEEVHGR